MAYTFCQEMNSYADILADAEEEVREFALTKNGAQWNNQWYDQICDLVRRIRTQESNDDAERLIDMLMWSVVDSGPLGCGFAPSIDRAADAMQRRRKRAHIERRTGGRP
jgi:hypothetical protein